MNAALMACICTWLLLVMKPNTAECHCIYLQTQIFMVQREVHVKGFILRIIEMNNYPEYMPCLKDVEGSPAEFDHTDVPFTSIELCYLVLSVIPYGLAARTGPSSSQTIFLWTLNS